MIYRTIAQLQKKAGSVAKVCEVLAATGLPPPRLELESTEGLLMRDQRAAMTVLKRLEALGVQLAVDDYTRDGPAARRGGA